MKQYKAIYTYHGEVVFDAPNDDEAHEAAKMLVVPASWELVDVEPVRCDPDQEDQ